VTWQDTVKRYLSASDRVVADASIAAGIEYHDALAALRALVAVDGVRRCGCGCGEVAP
jgi:2-keto-3-deoxy-L-rhamnonate aldolase RhmA